jgi:hypothetical protein
MTTTTAEQRAIGIHILAGEGAVGSDIDSIERIVRSSLKDHDWGTLRALVSDVLDGASVRTEKAVGILVIVKVQAIRSGVSIAH